MRNKYILIGVVGIVVGVLLASVVVVLAGNIDSPAGPTDPTAQMYTLEQIYDRLNSSTAATKQTTFQEPASGPGSTMHTLDDIYDLAWPARAPKTGQTTCYDVTTDGLETCAAEHDGQDAYEDKGVPWPNPRFTDNSDGTVTDNLTGLIWLKNANCFGEKLWAQALTDANTLNWGECNLTDSSNEGHWRLPNVREMQSLVHYGVYSPAVPNTLGTGKWTLDTPFDNVQSNKYWSSTTRAASNTDNAWIVSLEYGTVNYVLKSKSHYVWPVRGGQ